MPRTVAAALSGELGELLVLGHAHGQNALLEALTRATAFRRWRAEDVRSILANGHALVPRPAGDALPAVPTHSLADYAIAPSAIVPALDADLDAGLKRLKLAAMRRLAPELLVTAPPIAGAQALLRTFVEARSGKPPTPSTGAKPPRSRSRSLSRSSTSASPRSQAPPSTTSPGSEARRTSHWSARPAPASPTCSSRSDTPRSRPDTGYRVPGLHPRRPGRRTLPRSRRGAGREPTAGSESPAGPYPRMARLRGLRRGPPAAPDRGWKWRVETSRMAPRHPQHPRASRPNDSSSARSVRWECSRVEPEQDRPVRPGRRNWAQPAHYGPPGPASPPDSRRPPGRTSPAFPPSGGGLLLAKVRR